MHVDIYRRREPGNKYSYLLVPHGKLVPDEVTNVDWEMRQRGVAVDDAAAHLSPYEIDQPRLQIEDKGYAITSVMHQVQASDQQAP